MMKDLFNHIQHWWSLKTEALPVVPLTETFPLQEEGITTLISLTKENIETLLSGQLLVNSGVVGRNYIIGYQDDSA